MSEANVDESRFFEIDCSVLVKDNLLSTEDLKSYYESKMKVNGRVGNLGGNIDILATGEKIIISPKVQMSKKYLKYLGNKFLHRKELKDWVRIVTSGKRSYKLTYYKVNSNKDE